MIGKVCSWIGGYSAEFDTERVKNREIPKEFLKKLE